MSVSRYDASTGKLTTLASGQRIWVGTKEAYNTAKTAGTLPLNTLICITDDETEMDTEPTEDSPVAVTSDGIYKANQELDNKITKLYEKTDLSYIDVSPNDNSTEANRLAGINLFLTTMRERYPDVPTRGVFSQIRYNGGYYSTVIFAHLNNNAYQVIEFDTNRDWNIRIFSATGTNSATLMAKYSHD